jgi:hypothetical protein
MSQPTPTDDHPQDSAQRGTALRKLNTAISHAEEAITELGSAPKGALRLDSTVMPIVARLTKCLCRLETIIEAHDTEVERKQETADLVRKSEALLAAAAKLWPEMKP